MRKKQDLKGAWCAPLYLARTSFVQPCAVATGCDHAAERLSNHLSLYFIIMGEALENGTRLFCNSLIFVLVRMSGEEVRLDRPQALILERWSRRLFQLSPISMLFCVVRTSLRVLAPCWRVREGASFGPRRYINGLAQSLKLATSLGQCSKDSCSSWSRKDPS